MDSLCRMVRRFHLPVLRHPESRGAAPQPGGDFAELSAVSQSGQADIRITDQGSPYDEQDTLAFRLARDLFEAMGDTPCCSENPDGGQTVTIMLPGRIAAVRPGS